MSEYGPKNPRNKVFMDFIRGEADSLGGIAELSRTTGISRPTLTYWYNGERAPDSDSLILLSKKLGVSIDFMLTGVRSDNLEIAESTGLSDGAIEFLRYLNYKGNHYEYDRMGNINRETISFINRVLETEGARAKRDDDGDTLGQLTLFRMMEQYVCSKGITGTICETDKDTGEQKRATSKLILLNDPNMPIGEEIAKLMREAIFTDIRKYLEILREQEESKDGEH